MTSSDANVIAIKAGEGYERSSRIGVAALNTKTVRARTLSVIRRLVREFERLYEQSPKHHDGLVFGLGDDAKHTFDTVRRAGRAWGFALSRSSAHSSNAPGWSAYTFIRGWPSTGATGRRTQPIATSMRTSKPLDGQRHSPDDHRREPVESLVSSRLSTNECLVIVEQARTIPIQMGTKRGSPQKLGQTC